MVRKLNFSTLEDAAREVEDERMQRWSRREANPTVQMSIRMPTETYDRFRALCKKERRTNGDMLRILMEGHLERETDAPRK